MASIMLEAQYVRNVALEMIAQIEDIRRKDDEEGIEYELKGMRKSRRFWSRITLGLLKYREPTREEALDNMGPTSGWRWDFPSEKHGRQFERCQRILKIATEAGNAIDPHKKMITITDEDWRSIRG